MNFRKMIIVLTIAFSVIFASMIGTSYAYYVVTDGTMIDVTTANVDTGVAVVFEQSQYINMNTGIPIKESDADSLASSSVFVMTPDKTVLSGADTAINIGIVDISISSQLKVNDFKYKLSCNDVVIGSGTGKDFTDEVMSSGYLRLGTLSTVNNTFDVNKTYTCDLRIWLQENSADQNALMNKRFRGLIKVNTLFKK